MMITNDNDNDNILFDHYCHCQVSYNVVVVLFGQVMFI